MRTLVVLLLGMLIVIAVVTYIVLKVVSSAAGNLIDWAILTFGNEEAVRELKRRRPELGDGN